MYVYNGKVDTWDNEQRIGLAKKVHSGFFFPQ